MIYYSYLILIVFLSINHEKYKNIKNLEIAVFFLLFILIGFRFRTGGDYGPIILYFDFVTKPDQTLAVPYFHQLYKFVTYFSANILKLNVFGQNIILGFIFTYLLYFFLRQFKNIYLSLVISFPVIIMIYGFGSVRQGISIVLFLSVFSLNSYFKQALTLMIGVLFHATSAIYIIINFAGDIFTKGKLVMMISLVFILIMGIILFDDFLLYYKYYITQDSYISKGFIARNAVTFLCAITYCVIFIHNKKLIIKKFQVPFFIISIITLVVYPIGIFSSTAADRVMAYLLPLQIVVLNLIYDSANKKYKQHLNIFICTFYTLMFTIWIFFSDNAHAWVYEIFFFPTKFFYQVSPI